jgi:hypothetical protein
MTIHQMSSWKILGRECGFKNILSNFHIISYKNKKVYELPATMHDTGYIRTPGNTRTFDKQVTIHCHGTGGETGSRNTGVEHMKTILYNGSRTARVDTRADECLYAAPRPHKRSNGFRHQGKDLYIHTDPEKRITYYLHLWSTDRTVTDKIIPVSPASAERFLRGKGLVCNLFPKSDPIATLYRWGYGIAEEF